MKLVEHSFASITNASPTALQQLKAKLKKQMQGSQQVVDASAYVVKVPSTQPKAPPATLKTRNTAPKQTAAIETPNMPAPNSNKRKTAPDQTKQKKPKA